MKFLQEREALKLQGGPQSFLDQQAQLQEKTMTQSQTFDEQVKKNAMNLGMSPETIVLG